MFNAWPVANMRVVRLVRGVGGWLEDDPSSTGLPCHTEHSHINSYCIQTSMNKVLCKLTV